jgi:hypothetical protein
MGDHAALPVSRQWIRHDVENLCDLGMQDRADQMLSSSDGTPDRPGQPGVCAVTGRGGRTVIVLLLIVLLAICASLREQSQIGPLNAEMFARPVRIPGGQALSAAVKGGDAVAGTPVLLEKGSPKWPGA